MKALVKIAPIVIILACAASLFFAFRLSGQKTGLIKERADKTAELGKTTTKLTEVRQELDTAVVNLKQTQNDLASSAANLSAKETLLGQKTREAEELTKAKADAEEKATTLQAKIDESAKEMDALKEKLGSLDVGSIEDLTKKLEGINAENKMLGEKVTTLTAEKTVLAKKLDNSTTTPADLRGRVALTKSQWGFLIMDIGQEQHVQPNSEYLVYRDNSLIAKAKVTTVYPNSSVADLIPSFTKSPPREGDSVVYKKL